VAERELAAVARLVLGARVGGEVKQHVGVEVAPAQLPAKGIEAFARRCELLELAR